MTTYAIGDVQGCYDELQELLKLIQFKPEQDTLWFTGDLVNRGPKSLEVLRFVKNLPRKVVVLGNHDLHLLALAQGNPYKNHTLDEVLKAPDCDELIEWLRMQSLLHYDKNLDLIMVHAGLPAAWDLEQALDCAAEVEVILHSPSYDQLLANMYGDNPAKWDDHLKGWSRLRFIINALTRIRFCKPNGELDLNEKGEMGSQTAGDLPWFQVPNRRNKNRKIIFGHWAALSGNAEGENIFALDTGCVWGGKLTAMQIDNHQRFSVDCGEWKDK
jgi:bis(5'-nucleosyl)-tetraphosphatase (symmetrical)